MRKSISMLLCITTAAAMTAGLSGCGESSGNGGDTLVWYTFGDKPADLDAVLAKANEIIEPEIGMKLDMQYIDSASYQEKMKLKMASGEAYDLAFTGYTNDYQTAVSLGGLYDITDLIKEVGLDEVIPQFYFDAATVDGKIYGIPNVQVVSNPVCISIDKTLADEIDADMGAIEEAACNAKSYEDIVAYTALLDDLFAKIHEARPDLYVYNPTYNLVTTPRWEGLMGGTCILRDGSSNELVIDTETEDWRLGVDKLREWYTKGYIRNDIASKGTATSSNEENRQIAVLASTWKPGQDPYVKEIRLDDPVYALLHKPYVGRTSPLATMTSVGANTKHPKEAVEFLKLINTNKELFNIICWGIEGTHYTKDADGYVTEIADSGYTDIGKYAWKFGNQFNGLLTVGQEPTVWEETEKMNNEAVKSPMLGFVPNTDPITNELANITNVDSEFSAKKGMGTADASEWLDDYLAKREQAGVQKVKEELQKQYNEFLASK
jgi:putative aldouronate transport system substrate-binding protein